MTEEAQRPDPGPAGICHIEIPAPRIDETRRFYSEVFGWTIEPVQGMDYMTFNAGSLGGGFDPSIPVSDAGVNLVIAVEDIPKKLTEIAKSGGEIMTEKTRISEEHGYYGQFKDPNGNRMGLWSKT